MYKISFLLFLSLIFACKQKAVEVQDVYAAARGTARPALQQAMADWFADHRIDAMLLPATMVAAVVLLLGRVYPLFTPEALLVIATVGLITLFIPA